MLSFLGRGKYIHTYIHTYIYACIRTYIHTYLRNKHMLYACTSMCVHGRMDRWVAGLSDG